MSRLELTPPLTVLIYSWHRVCILMVSGQPSHVERVHMEVRHRIVHGGYAPGVPLSEAKLARELRASRTPVREALSRLLEEGYVERIPRRGFFVARVTVAMIHNVFEIRRLLEGAAAARAAELATPEDLGRLRALADYRYADGVAANRKAYEINAQFHTAVAAATRNGLLVDLVRNCIDQVTRFMALGVSLQTFQEAASDEHLAIVDAIEQKDPAAARRAAEQHLDASSRFLMKALMNGDIRGVSV